MHSSRYVGISIVCIVDCFQYYCVLGRLVPGILSDKFGHFNIMIAMLIGFTLSMLILWLPFGSNIGSLCICRYFWIFQLIDIEFNSSVFRKYHTSTEIWSKIWTIVFFVSLGNLFGIPVSAAIIGNGSKHPYDMFAVYCCVFGVVGTCCWFISRFYIVGLKLNVRYNIIHTCILLTIVSFSTLRFVDTCRFNCRFR